MTDAKVIAGLSETQRWAVTGEARRSHGAMLIVLGNMATTRALNRKGILDGTAFTPLGLSIRQALLNEDRT